MKAERQLANSTKYYDNKQLAAGLTFPNTFGEKFKLCRQKRTRTVHGYAVPIKSIAI